MRRSAQERHGGPGAAPLPCIQEWLKCVPWSYQCAIRGAPRAAPNEVQVARGCVFDRQNLGSCWRGRPVHMPGSEAIPPLPRAPSPPTLATASAATRWPRHRARRGRLQPTIAVSFWEHNGGEARRRTSQLAVGVLYIQMMLMSGTFDREAFCELCELFLV